MDVNGETFISSTRALRFLWHNPQRLALPIQLEGTREILLQGPLSLHSLVIPDLCNTIA
jgi:hypothetical protein